MSLWHRLRWPVWLSLLGVAAWLALFGGKTPNGISSLAGAADGSGAGFPARTANMTAAASPIGAAPALPARRNAERAIQAAGYSADEALEALQPRDKLIAAPSTHRRVRDLFAPVSWTPPVEAAPALPPATPAAALPFVFLGKKVENGLWEVYVARGDRTLIARPSSILDSSYRVDAIAPPILTMTHLPTSQVLTLNIGEAR